MKSQDQFVATDRALEELDAALSGELTGPAADSWRTLREDVRSLPSPIDPDFHDSLRARLGSTPATTAQARSRRTTWSPFRNPQLTGGLIASLAAIAVAIVIVAHFSGGSHRVLVPSGISRSPTPSSAAAEVKGAGTSAPKADEAPAAGVQSSPATTSSARVQELGASIALATSSAQIQLVADRVSRLAVSEGGYVESSHIEVAAKASEATLQLNVPSAKLTRILTALGRLAPVRAESQSLQDITGSYATAKRQLADLLAERAALLRALARTSTQGAIESLHRRLSLVGGALARAQATFGALSRRASNSSIEVTVLAGGALASEGLTLHRGLHDAGRVLSVVLIGLLIGLAGALPALLILALAVSTVRRGRRAMRERALL